MLDHSTIVNFTNKEPDRAKFQLTTYTFSFKIIEMQQKNYFN